ncbi:RICIN domain-containing protein [Actinosynnema sp. CS-041913]|uniref:RICIN domain-containing protein n=1 Tax=Actinosynnema sp. CS-041913 TaxID=3239917 RepID=UPI003D8ECF1C
MKFGRVAAALAAVVLGLLMVVPTASAAADTVMWSKWNDTYLDYNPNNGVHARGWNGGPWQRWEVTQYSDGTVRYMNVATKMCLDNSEHGLRGFGCNDGPWQRWRVKNWGDSTRELVSVWNNHCLDNSQYGVRTVGCNGLVYQRWRV